MNRNSYVTAALFVVFALLTAFYWTMDEAPKDSTVLQTTAPEGINVDVNGVDALVDGEQESSSIEQLRLTLAAERSRKVDELKEVVASSDYDAMAKSEAKDSITKISKEYEHAQVLESMIKAKGYDDVLVRVNDEAVQVIVQVQDLEAVTVDATNELYMMAKTEFTNDPFVTIEFQPVN